MQEFRFSCPACNVRLRLRNRMLFGQTIDCPDCGGQFIVRRDTLDQLQSCPVSVEATDDEKGGGYRRALTLWAGKLTGNPKIISRAVAVLALIGFVAFLAAPETETVPARHENSVTGDVVPIQSSDSQPAAESTPADNRPQVEAAADDGTSSRDVGDQTAPDVSETASIAVSGSPSPGANAIPLPGELDAAPPQAAGLKQTTAAAGELSRPPTERSDVPDPTGPAVDDEPITVELVADPSEPPAALPPLAASTPPRPTAAGKDRQPGAALGPAAAQQGGNSENAPRDNLDVQKALELPILTFKQTTPAPLRRVLDLISEMAGVELKAAAGIPDSTLESRVAVSLQQTTVGGILEAVLGQAGLVHSIEGGRVLVRPDRPSSAIREE